MAVVIIRPYVPIRPAVRPAVPARPAPVPPKRADALPPSHPVYAPITTAHVMQPASAPAGGYDHPASDSAVFGGLAIALALVAGLVFWAVS